MNSPMKPLLRRHYATKYTAVITNSNPTSNTISIKVPPIPLPQDPRGYPLPRRDLICRVAQLLSQNPQSTPNFPRNYKYTPDPFLDLSDYLQTLSVTLTPSECSEILKSVRSPKVALEFFLFCKTLDGFKHDCFSYNRIVMILGRAGSEESVMRIVSDMEKEGVRGNVSMVNLLIGIAGGGKELEKCLELGRKWEARFTGYTYKCLLQAHLRLRDVEKASRVYNEMRRKGHGLDIFAYNMFIDASAKAEKVDEAYKVLEDMKHKFCEPDAYTYTILIRMAGKQGKTDDVLSFFKEMIGKSGQLDEAHMRFKEMGEKGLNPDVITYSTLIECFGKSRRVETACRLFDEMLSEGCSPNIVTYNILLDCLEKHGKVEEAFELYSRLKHQGLTPDSVTYSVLERLESGVHRTVRARKQSRISGWVVSPLRG